MYRICLSRFSDRKAAYTLASQPTSINRFSSEQSPGWRPSTSNLALGSIDAQMIHPPTPQLVNDAVIPSVWIRQVASVDQAVFQFAVGGRPNLDS